MQCLTSQSDTIRTNRAWALDWDFSITSASVHVAVPEPRAWG
jgi:hypothetical protein